MKLFDVYPLFDIEPVKGQGCYVFDNEGQQYLDFYGGHAVISIGHSHPHYVQKVTQQLSALGFYSNSVQNPLQVEFARKLGEASGRPDYQLFLCNSGAEANENALKMASFHTGRKKIVSFSNGFHGRTSLAVAVTDNAKIVAPVNETKSSVILPFNDMEALEKTFAKKGDEIAAVIVEGIQGLAGIYVAENPFLQKIRSLCDEYGAVFVADSVQCGYGRSGKFYSFDYADVEADIYTMAKGIGNGFPMGAIALNPKFEASYGLLGTTFGGNHLACAAGIAVLDVMKAEHLVENAFEIGNYIMEKVPLEGEVKEVRGRGLMIGIELDYDATEVRKELLFKHHIFTGTSKNKNVIRLLPPLSAGKDEADRFLNAFVESMNLKLA